MAMSLSKGAKLSAMRLLILMILVSVLAVAQSSSSAEVRIDFNFDADIRNLFEMIGVRRGVVEKRDQALSDGRNAMRRAFPNVSQEFVDEWERRFRSKFNPNDFINACVRVYAKYFSDDEVKQQISYRTAMAKGERPVLPVALQKKMDSVMPAVQRDFDIEGNRIGAKLGTDVGAEIEKEHPEWVKKPADSKD
jgi:hypothetical protein